jgi:hypothetical protein
MFGSAHALPGAEFVSGTLALSVFFMGAVLAVLAVFGVFAFRRAGQAGTPGVLWRAALVLVGAVLAWALLDRSTVREHVADRRAFDARVAELTVRAIAPGSPLACLDGVASAAVEAACEKALFAGPEAIAAGVAYVDAKFSLLPAGIALAARDPSYEPVLQRLRRAIEADRYGFVAHALTTRGCVASDCADLKLLRDPKRVLANMKARSFDAQVALHGTAWHPPASSLAVAPMPVAPAEQAPQAAIAPQAPQQTMGGGAAAPMSSRYDFPSAASIPPVSIMNAEPALPPEPRAVPEPRAASAPPARQSAQSPRRQSREPPRESAPPHQPLPVGPDGGAPSGQIPVLR